MWNKLILKKLIFVICCVLILVLRTKKEDIALPGQLSQIELGMSQKKVNNILDKLAAEGVLHNGVFFIDSLEVLVRFYFCANCWGNSLEGVEFKTLHPNLMKAILEETLRNKKRKNVHLKNLIKRNSLDQLVAFDTSSFVFTNKLVYEPSLQLLRCKRQLSSSCF